MASVNNDYEGYGPITPILRTYGGADPAKPQPTFLQRLLTALYGESGSLSQFRAFDRNDPAALARLGLAVLRGFPKGIDDFWNVLIGRLALFQAAAQGYAAVLTENPKHPGTISENNPLIVHLAKTGGLESLQTLGRELRKLDRSDVWTALNVLTNIVMQAVVNSVADYREKLMQAKSVDEFGELLGRMWGYVSADAILNALAWRSLDAGAKKIGRINLNLAQRKLTQLDLSIEEGYRRSAVYLRVQQRFEELEKKRLGPETLSEIIDGVDGRVQRSSPALLPPGQPAQKTLPGAKTAPGSPAPKALPGDNLLRLPAGVRNFLLGDREPTPGLPISLPSGSVLVQLIPTKWNAVQIAQIRTNILARPGIPAWMPNLSNEQIFQIAALVESHHPKTVKITDKVLELKISQVAGGIQETVNPMRPEFAQDRDMLIKLLDQEKRWDLDTLEFAPRLFTLEPIANTSAAPRAQVTDGVWIIRAKSESVYLIPMIYESKSLSNTNDLFYERVDAFKATTGEPYSVRDANRAQPYRDIERLSNLDVILEIPISGGTTMRTIYLPANWIGISRKTTRLRLITPRKPEGLKAMSELVSAGFTKSNIVILPPAYDRKEIEMFARRLLEAPYDKIIPKPKP